MASTSAAASGPAWTLPSATPMRTPRSAPPSPGASLAQSPAHFSRSGSAPRTPTRSAAVAGAFASPAELTAALLRQHLADEAGQSSSAPRTPRAAPRVDPISVQFARARKAAEELDTADVYAVLEEEEALRFTYAALSELDSEASDDDGSSGAIDVSGGTPRSPPHSRGKAV